MESDSPPDQPSWLLVLSALAVAAGIYIGISLGGGDISQFGKTLWNIGLAGMLAAGVLAMPFRFGRAKVHHRPLPLIAWFFVFTGLGYAGSWISVYGLSSPWVSPLTFVILGLAPVASALTGAASLRWILHPFTLRQLADGNLPLRLRLSLLFLAVTAWAPGGGLVAPLWAATRRRLQAPAAPLPVAPPRPSISNTALLASLPTEKRNYLILHGIELQVKAGATEKLFRSIEKHPFFAEQATCSGGFLRGSEDIEKHILPLVLQTGDWERFLRYCMLAINLRRMADDLAEPDLLPALARHGHWRMASGAAARISDPAERALGRAVLAASLDPDDAERETLLGFVRGDLALLTPIDDPQEAEARAVALVRIGFYLGPDILSSLEGTPPPREGQEPRPGLLAMSVAVGALHRNGGLDERGWSILRNLQEEQVLAEFLPDPLGHAAATVEAARLLDNLSMLALKPETLWACRLSILAAWARTSPEEAGQCWEVLRANPPLPWSVALIDRGAPLFAILSDPEIDSREQEIQDPVVRAALHVAVLEHRPEGAPDTAARKAIERLPPGPERLHWTLRYTTASPMPEKVRQDATRAIGRWLFEQQHRAPLDDLRRYLELVARCLPEELQRRAEDVLLSPGGGLPLLRYLAEFSDSHAVLKNLFEQAESYLSSLVGLPDLEALRLWRDLMYQLTGRLCLLRVDLTALDQAADKLRETDPLAARVTATLAGAGSMDLAAEAASRIRSGRLRLATRLRWLPETVTSSGELEPEPLYNALAWITALEDEWLGLPALHYPDPPEIRFLRYLDRIGDRDTQVI
ncbi:MAG TPA: DMT family transporter, partial [Thermoanaerobaculia bacterium]|nr:DMT family transporter [Thermoanaerobaculia bacterium]